jgi:hypothetical protein
MVDAAMARAVTAATSDPNLKFATLFRKVGANFRFKRVTSNYMILVWFKDLKFAPHPAS